MGLAGIYGCFRLRRFISWLYFVYTSFYPNGVQTRTKQGPNRSQTDPRVCSIPLIPLSDLFLSRRWYKGVSKGIKRGIKQNGASGSLDGLLKLYFDLMVYRNLIFGGSRCVPPLLYFFYL